jgi:2-dehydropantoate 2-reductase
MSVQPRLVISGGPLAGELALTHADLQAFPAADQVADVAALAPGRRGRAVRLAALLARVRAPADAAWLDVASSDPAFAVSVPLSEVRQAGLVVYELDGAPLPPSKGGPFRLLVPGHADECVHVKGLARLECARTRGRDTRPKDDAEHAALHRSRADTGRARGA